MPQVLDRNLSDRLGISLEPDLLVVDARCLVGPGDVFQCNPPPGTEGECAKFFAQVFCSPSSCHKLDVHLVECVEIGVGGEP